MPAYFHVCEYICLSACVYVCACHDDERQPDITYANKIDLRCP